MNGFGDIIDRRFLCCFRAPPMARTMTRACLISNRACWLNLQVTSGRGETELIIAAPPFSFCPENGNRKRVEQRASLFNNWTTTWNNNVEKLEHPALIPVDRILLKLTSGIGRRKIIGQK